MKWLFREPSRDPQLGAAMRRLETEATIGESDLLRQRIVAAAGARLRQLRSPTPSWWEWISRWVPVAVPVGLAASLATAFLVPSSDDLLTAASSTVDVGADSALVLAAFSDPSGGELAAHMVAPASGEWLFEEAVTQ